MAMGNMIFINNLFNLRHIETSFAVIILRGKNNVPGKIIFREVAVALSSPWSAQLVTMTVLESNWTETKQKSPPVSPTIW